MQGQQVVPAGGAVSKPGFNVEWIIAGKLAFDFFMPVKEKSDLQQFSEITRQVEYTLTVFPVPARDMVTVRIFPVPGREIILKIMDGTGKRLMRVFTVTDLPFQMDLSWLPAGFYVLNALFPDSSTPVMCRKIIKI